jgi:hypothetical protein
MDSRIHPFSVVATHRSSRESQFLDLSGRRIRAPTPMEAGVSVAGLVIRARKNGANDKSFAPPT